MTTLILKKCSKCEELKEISEFAIRKKIYVNSRCKQCEAKIIHEWGERNKDKLKKNNILWKKKHPGITKSIVLICNKKARDTLNDSYIKDVLRKLTKRRLPINDYTNELIEAKRLQLTLHRLIKKHEHLQNNLGI
jgi:hypothetical protein